MKKVSKIILINPVNEFLLYLRDDIPTIVYPGYWDFFGRGIKKNETPLQGLEREIGEETNVLVKNIKNIGNICVPENNNDYLFMYKGDIDILLEDVRVYEGRETRYFQYKEIFELKLPQFFKDFVRENKKNYLFK